jgi:DNA polymerase
MSIDPHTCLAWQIDMGVDMTIGDQPVNRLKQMATRKSSTQIKSPKKADDARPTKRPAKKPMGQQDALIQAKELAAGADTLEQLQDIIRNFDGLSIKQTAMNCVFADGPDDRKSIKAMIIGEAPGADEDRQGKPFVGKSGQLLDKMLAAIGLDRTQNAYITNVINWRPPGNRTPTDGEIALSKPFIQQHIELVDPPAILLIGGIASKSFVDNYSSLGRLRGSEVTIQCQTCDYPARATYHPAYLLRRPAHKGRAWQDLLQFKVNYLTD